MKLTARGKRLVVGLILLLGFGVLFLDLLLLAVVLFGAAFLVYELGDAVYLARGGGSFRLEPTNFDAKIIRGTDKRFEPTLRTSRAIRLDASSAQWLSLGSSSFATGEWPVEVGLSSELAGSYASDGIPAEVMSRYGFFSIRTVIPLNISLRVYPRFIATALAALEFLMRSGAGTEGEVERNLIGTGLEYAETREYQSGDSLRRIDWRATARSSTLMVKHYFREGGGALHVIYSVEAPGPRTHDELATQLIDLVLSAAIRGTPISVTAYQKGARLSSFTGSGRIVLASTLNLVFATSGVSYDDVYSMLDVISISKERRAMLLAGRKRLAELLQRAGGREHDLVIDFRGLVAQLASLDVMPSFIVLSSLIAGRALVAEAIDELRGRRAGVTVVYPPKPWRDAPGLEGAYVMARAQEKMLRYAESAGCEIGPIPFRLSPLVGTPSAEGALRA